MEGYVYILESSKNGRYYIGSTVNLESRLKEHNGGKNISTRNLRPWNLVFCQKCCNIRLARQMEYKLKKYKSRIIIEK